MKKKALSILLVLLLSVVSTACGGLKEAAKARGPREEKSVETPVEKPVVEEVFPEETEPFHIGLVTSSRAQSEDDRRGAEEFQRSFGAGRVTLATYPDNFSEAPEETIEIILKMAEDPEMKAIIVNQGVDGTAEAFRRVKEKRPDILCIAGQPHEAFSEINAAADLVVLSDFVARGYLMIKTAHDLGCHTFVHISFPRHLSHDTISRRLAVMQAACEEFGMEFVMETAPDPTTEVGVSGAQRFILQAVPEWIKKYGKDTAFFCTNDAHTEPLIRKLIECGGYFIEADLPSPLMGYPGALGLDLSDDTGDFGRIIAHVEAALVEQGGAGRFGTWTSSYGYSLSSALAEHAANVIDHKSELTDIDDLSRAFKVFSPGAEWNGSHYTDPKTGTRTDNMILVYQDTYIFGDPGHYMGTTKVEIPEKYFTID